MSTEEIIKAWKSDEYAADAKVPANPVGEELTEEELKQVAGGMQQRFTPTRNIIFC